jgi:hypothetical protein
VSRKLLEKRLQSLTIRQADCYTTFKTPNVALTCFSNLTRLSIPTDALISMAQKPTAVDEALPSSLRHLQINPCNRYISLWLPDLATACFNGVLPRLCHVDLHFRDCLSDSLIWIDQGRGLLKPLRDMIGLLRRNYGISLRGYNRSGIYTGDLLAELDAWAHLSTTELWYPASKGVEFSSIVAKTEEGAPRRRSKEEIRTYIKRDRLSQKSVFTRKYIFKPEVELQVKVPIPFYTDTKQLPKIVQPKFTSEFARWLASIAATQRKSESALRGTLIHLNVKSLGEIEKPGKQSQIDDKKLSGTSSDGNVATTIPDMFRVLSHCRRPHIAFNANKWLGLKFFEDIRSKMGEGLVSSKRKNYHKRVHTMVQVSSKSRRVRAKLSD